jgi:transcriptional regulator with PAS, ATPase and Fis domain
VDIRILAATNKDLKHEVQQGSFRQDLYFRLNVISLHVPPLAERRDDIPLLCHHFVKKFSEVLGKDVEGVSDDALRILMDYEFPGNVRELENIIERAVTLTTATTIGVELLPLDLRQASFRIQSRRHKEYLSLEENERTYIEWVLQQVDDNKTRAAEILGIDRVSLWRKLKRYNLD